MAKKVPIPRFVSRPIAARLLGFDPPSGFARHVAECPHLFQGSTPRLYAMDDLNAHPNRKGRPVTAAQFLRVDNLLAEQRAYWRDKNARRAAGTLIRGRGKWQVQKKAEAGDA
jgi:hypothetical protein